MKRHPRQYLTACESLFFWSLLNELGLSRVQAAQVCANMGYTFQDTQMLRYIMLFLSELKSENPGLQVPHEAGLPVAWRLH